MRGNGLHAFRITEDAPSRLPGRSFPDLRGQREVVRVVLSPLRSRSGGDLQQSQQIRWFSCAGDIRQAADNAGGADEVRYVMAVAGFACIGEVSGGVSVRIVAASRRIEGIAQILMRNDVN